MGELTPKAGDGLRALVDMLEATLRQFAREASAPHPVKVIEWERLRAHADRMDELELKLAEAELDYKAVMRLHYPWGDGGYCCGLRDIGPGIHEAGCPVAAARAEGGSG